MRRTLFAAAIVVPAIVLSVLSWRSLRQEEAARAGLEKIKKRFVERAEWKRWYEGVKGK